MKTDLIPLAERLRRARDAALETIRWVAEFQFPDFEQDYEFVALRHPDEYPLNEGRIVSSKGLDIAVREYDAHFEEQRIIVRAVEVLHACEEALRIIETYEAPEQSAVDVCPRLATGYGCTEAPRGILYHRYCIDGQGMILDAKIVPPTSQNQKTIERDLWKFVPKYLDLPGDKLRWQCEQAIRNYDPCISCATHFLKLKVERD